jgi:signal transduction histidine kinase
MILKSLKSRIIFAVTGIVAISLAVTIFFFGQSIKRELANSFENNALNMLEATKNHVESQHKSILYHKKITLSRRKIELKNNTIIAFSIVNSAYDKFQAGQLSEDQAKTQAKKDLNKLRYSDGVGYFWINDTTRPYPRMIMHPTISNLDGNILDNPEFFCALGKNENLFKAFVDVCLDKKEGYVDYLWPKPTASGLTEQQPKLSYVKLFKPWNWIIGTGVYIDDIEKDVQARIEAVITDLNAAIKKQRIGDSGYFFIFDKNNKVLAHPNLQGADGATLINPLSGRSIIEDIRNVTNNSSPILEYLWDKPRFKGQFRFRKKAYVTLYKPLGWYICSTVYQDDLEKGINKLLKVIFIFSAFCILVSIIIALIVANSIAKPLNRLISSIAETDENGIPVREIPSSDISEVEVLTITMNNMITSISRSRESLIIHKDRLEELVSERTNELQESLDKLNDAKDQLVESEKMAALGGLVAGVAHEINTPIGIGVTAASHLEDKTKKFFKVFESGKISKKELQFFLDVVEESSRLILSNMNRAADLVQSFKQVAVDQMSRERRRFNFKEYIDEVLLSLRPKYKKTNFKVLVDCPEDFSIDSFPGAISQILTNLVVNSLTHGFENKDTGEIKIEVQKENKVAKLIFEDNGIGFSDEVKNKIFEPFFTTKRGTGGTGLGMHIVYNLVTQTLNGSIKCLSREGEGSIFEIEFPCEVSIH